MILVDSVNLSNFRELSKKLSVLYVEDDKQFSLKMQELLQEFFLQCDLAFNGEEGLQKYQNFYLTQNKFYDIVITDIVMPYMSGVTFCKKLLQINKYQEIIVISAYGNKNELIELINLGIKRFIEKPFTSNEIIHKLNITLEQTKKDIQKKVLYLAKNLKWDPLLKQLFYNDIRIQLSYNETVILELFIEHPSTVFSNFDLFNIVEEGNFYDEFSQDKIKTIIKRLRKKLPFNIIKNIYGIGYKLQLEYLYPYQ